MAQITTGLRSVLSLPAAYDLLMDTIGANKLRKIWVEQYIRPRPDDQMLDVGCGTGAVVAFLPRDVTYLGIDLSPDYVASAQRQHGERARFQVGDVNSLAFEPDETFDLVTAVGLLHHLDDGEVRRLAKAVHGLLKSNGRFITIDNCFTPEQSPLAKAIIRRDRGQNVRTPEEYQAIIQDVFARVTSEVRHDLLRIPYTHVIIEAMVS
jgi:SAM-dependent methyltransferase